MAKRVGSSLAARVGAPTLVALACFASVSTSAAQAQTAPAADRRSAATERTGDAAPGPRGAAAGPGRADAERSAPGPDDERTGSVALEIAGGAVGFAAVAALAALTTWATWEEGDPSGAPLLVGFATLPFAVSAGVQVAGNGAGGDGGWGWTFLGSLLGGLLATVADVLLAAGCTGSHDAVCDDVPLLSIAGGIAGVFAIGGGVLAYEASASRGNAGAER